MAEKEPAAMSANSPHEQDTIRIHRGRMDSITVYDVTDQELLELQKGGDGGIYLNLALTFASIAFSFLIALSTTTITSDRLFTVFVVVVCVSTVCALVLGILWWKCRKSVQEVVNTIKARMPQDEEVDKDKDDPTSVDKGLR